MDGQQAGATSQNVIHSDGSDLMTASANTLHNALDDTTPFTVIDAPATRSGRIRRTRDFAMLSVCTCGEAVSPDEISTGEKVIQCKKTGCETRWVRPLYSRKLFELTDFMAVPFAVRKS